MLQSRRRLLTALLGAPALSAALPGGWQALAAGTLPGALALTPACGDDDAPTPAQTAGPFFTPETPVKRDFAADSPGGERLTIGGWVLDETCTPVPKALIELWHANEDGRYDNEGYRLRGHEFADESGRWWFDTIVPGLYPGRTRHYHLKVQRPGGSLLTTQLYFPGEPGNASDFIYDPTLLLEIGETEDGRFGRYDFVVG